MISKSKSKKKRWRPTTKLKKTSLGGVRFAPMSSIPTAWSRIIEPASRSATRMQFSTAISISLSKPIYCRRVNPHPENDAVSGADLMQPFAQRLKGNALTRRAIDVLQVNMGKYCNQACIHCHVEAGPTRTEMMSRETTDAVLRFLERANIPTLDITGGAPELN